MGSSLDETNLLYGVFLLSNRTEEAMTNIGITLSVATEDDVLFDNKSIYLDQEHFGILEPDTVMPVYVELDINQLESVEELSDSRQETTYISDVMFDIPGKNPDSRDPEGFEVGYRPEYIMAQANEENREGQWEESAPEIEYVLPDNIDQGDISTVWYNDASVHYCPGRRRSSLYGYYRTIRRCVPLRIMGSRIIDRGPTYTDDLRT